MINNAYPNYVTAITIGMTSAPNNNIIDLINFIDLSKNSTTSLTYSNNSGGLNVLMNIYSVSLDLVYEPNNQVFVRENLGELINTSSIDDLEIVYYNQLGLSVPIKIVPAEPVIIPDPVPTSTSTTTTQSININTTTQATSTTPIIAGLYTGTITSVTVTGTTTREIISTSTRDIVSTSSINVISTSTKEVVNTITNWIVSTTSRNIVSTSTQMKTFWIGLWEKVTSSLAWDEFKGATTIGTKDVATTSMIGAQQWIGTKTASVNSKQRIVLNNLIINEPVTLNIYSSQIYGIKPFAISTISGSATMSTTTFAVAGGVASKATPKLNTNTINFTPKTSSLTLELGPKDTTLNNYFYLDAYKLDLPQIVYATTTLVSTTSTPVVTYSTTTQLVTNTTPTLVTSTSTVIYTATNTEIVQVTNNVAVDNPNSYPYTFDELTGKAIFYISQSPFATSTNPLDTPCTLNLKTCKTNKNNLTDILTNYQQQNSYNNTLEYTKYHPSQYYEQDSRGIITLSIPFNGKTISTYKYGKNNYTGNTGSAVQTDCNQINSNCSEYTELSYIHLNYLATPVILTDMKASTTQIIKTDSWGNQISSNYNKDSNIPTKIGYTGHKYDQDTDLTYAHARYLSTNREQWLSLDPISTDGFSTEYFLLNPQYQNSYSYASNNPVNNIDPDGRAVYAGVKAIDGNSIGSHMFLFMKPDDLNTSPEYGNEWVVGGYNSDNTLVSGINSEYDLAVLRDGYVSKNGDKLIGFSKGFEKVQTPEGETDREFISSIMEAYKSYKNDAAYDPFVISGNNSNVFASTLLQNSGVKNLPFKGNMPGIDPGYGKNLGSNYKVADSKSRLPQNTSQVISAISVYGSKNTFTQTSKSTNNFIIKPIKNIWSNLVNRLSK